VAPLPSTALEGSSPARSVDEAVAGLPSARFDDAACSSVLSSPSALTPQPASARAATADTAQYPLLLVM
jgi:hypothetical protein